MSREAGNDAFRSGDLQRAADLYTAALDTDPGDSKLWGNLAEVWLRTCQFDRALVDASRSAELDPSSAKAHYRVARALLGLEAVDDSVTGARERALKSLLLSMAAAPDSKDVLELLADLTIVEPLPEEQQLTLGHHLKRAIASGADVTTIQKYLQLGVSPLARLQVCDLDSDLSSAAVDQVLTQMIGSPAVALACEQSSSWLWSTPLHVAVAGNELGVLEVIASAVLDGELNQPCCAAHLENTTCREAPALAVAILSWDVEKVELLLRCGATADAPLPRWGLSQVPGSMLALALDGAPSVEEQTEQINSKREKMKRAARLRARGEAAETWSRPEGPVLARRGPVVALLIESRAQVEDCKVRLSDGSEVCASELVSDNCKVGAAGR